MESDIKHNRQSPPAGSEWLRQPPANWLACVLLPLKVNVYRCGEANGRPHSVIGQLWWLIIGTNWRGSCDRCDCVKNSGGRLLNIHTSPCRSFLLFVGCLSFRCLAFGGATISAHGALWGENCEVRHLKPRLASSSAETWRCVQCTGTRCNELPWRQTPFESWTHDHVTDNQDWIFGWVRSRKPSWNVLPLKKWLWFDSHCWNWDHCRDLLHCLDQSEPLAATLRTISATPKRKQIHGA